MSNTYKLRGNVAAITEPRTFPSGYTLQEMILLDESNPQYPQRVAIGFGGDRIAQLASLTLGQEVEVAFGIRCTETADGRHFVNLRGWGVSTISAAPVQTVAPIGPASGGASPPGEPPAVSPPTTTGNPALEDLPF